MHYDIFNTLCRQFRSNSFGHLLGIAVHTSIGNDHTFIGIIATQFIIDTYYLRNIIGPHRTMSRANYGDRQSAQFLQSLLYGVTIFSYYIRIVTHHFIPIVICIDTGIKETTIQRTKTAKSISGEKNAIRFVKSHHCLRPMHHWSKIKTKFMFSQCKEVTVFHQILFTCYPIEAFNHAKGLLIAYNYDIRIMLFDQPDGARMVRFHMIYN